MSTPVRDRPGFGKLERLLVAGVVCIAASAGTAIAQLGGTGARPSVIPANAFAEPYAQALGGYPGDESPPSTGVVRTTPTARVAPPCPIPTLQKLPGVQELSPIMIVISRLGIDAAVERAGLDRRGDMQVPRSPCDVAWFTPGPAPGSPGNAVIDGHLDWTSGPSVFSNLHQLSRGDEVDVLNAGGNRVRFVVARLRYVPRSTHSAGLFATTGDPTLSLYTCAGTWDARAQTYTQRLIVDATLVR